ncbi:MAG: hypothetical protein ISS76_12255 [Phycisphaerae bacterium]|nr:hypothetical protein [Phycisphaerae bacterium]
MIHLSPLAICLAGGRIVFRGEPLTGLVLAVGGLTLPLVLVQLFAGIGSQHFYPEESTMGAWTTIFLSVGVHTELTRVQEGVVDVIDVQGDRPLRHPAISAAGA